MAQSAPFSDIVQEAQRIVDSAQKNQIILRLFGGMAVRVHCPSATHRQLARKYADIDFMGLRKQSRSMKKLFTDLDTHHVISFNQLHGYTRMVFNDIPNERQVASFSTFLRCVTSEIGSAPGLLGRTRLLIPRTGFRSLPRFRLACRIS